MHRLRNMAFVVALILFLCLSSCSYKQADTASGISSSDPANSAVDKVDIDLTGFSPNMLYAEVYNMGVSPKDYIGKVIKITGEFAHFPELDKDGNPFSDKEILVCIVSDAMACCAMGLEFVPEEGSSFSENYPKDGTKITVTGVCDIFIDKSGFFTVIQLNDAHIEQADKKETSQ